MSTVTSDTEQDGQHSPANGFRSSRETIEVFDQHVIPNYRRYPISLVRGEGSYVWDAEGHRYLDLFPGWGCNILGYSHPKVVEAIKRQADQLIHVPNTWYTEPQGDFAKELCTRSFGKAFFCNSGAEAIEAAIKLARLHTPPEKFRIITFEQGFHGRTYGALAATAQPKYHEGLGPMVAGFRYAPRNDLDAVAQLIDEETCAILIEPVQGEGGVNLPAEGFLQGLRDLADQHELVLIFDEIQTGMGRLGTWFGYQHFGVQPDVLTLAKGVAGGVACGGLIAKDELAPSLRPGMHASTFGGNPLAMAAGLATLRVIHDENLLEHVHEISSHVAQTLSSAADEIEIIEDVRVCGMMIGIQLKVDATSIVGTCMERGVLVNVTQGNVIRMLPALNISREHIDEGLGVVLACVRELDAAT